MGWSRKKKNKYGAQRIVTDEFTYDSKREKRCHDLLRKFKIPHQFQVEYELQTNFRNPSGKAIRRIYMVIDFVILLKGKILFVDTKGIVTKDAALKYKMLEYKQYRNNKEYEVHFLKTDKKVDSFVISLYEQFKPN